MAENNDNKYTFTPIHPFTMDQPKTWAQTIGQLNWDNDKIVFSKRSLLEFLKACQVTVGTNLTEIQKLPSMSSSEKQSVAGTYTPEYATFGRLSQAATDEAVKDLVEAEINDPVDSKPSSPDGPDGLGAVPSQPRFDPPGGKSSLAVNPEEFGEADSVTVTPAEDGGPGFDVHVDRMEHLKVHVEPELDGGATITAVSDEKKGDSAAPERESNPPPNFRPTRKVREGPGGKSQMGAAMFGGVEDEEDVEAPRKRADKNASSNLW
ncbi:hypothetical protein CspeluHIS016_0201290 [Cutaneotrichosporon spelunceum]|uniref:Uncharacterized protein n=1 Tax=Cutaneotrichosporon spelunceum TaxID=1672016 RepID=A0AAD3YAI3_9TREE|nr:hypothetical protein CspeluHIS016_0201290 [Cutaneotrichosporon spelunceum]